MSTKLSPTDPPGRRTRKARVYWTDIQRLRARGYTFEAIRSALAAVGVDVSNRTVQREAARPPDVRDDTTNALLPAQRRGKDVAEAFRRSQCANPLIRAKDKS
jgi:hypothetical protein